MSGWKRPRHIDAFVAMPVAHEDRRRSFVDTEREWETLEGDIRSGSYAAYGTADCEHIRLGDAEIDRRLQDGPPLVSANFDIPYPPGFQIMMPGQVVTHETIDFVHKLDVKKIHGYSATAGLKLIRDSTLDRLMAGQPGARC